MVESFSFSAPIIISTPIKLLKNKSKQDVLQPYINFLDHKSVYVVNAGSKSCGLPFKS